MSARRLVGVTASVGQRARWRSARSKNACVHSVLVGTAGAAGRVRGQIASHHALSGARCRSVESMPCVKSVMRQQPG